MNNFAQGSSEFPGDALAPPPSQAFSDYQEYYDRYLFSNCYTFGYYALKISHDFFTKNIHNRLPYTYDETALALTERPPYPDYSLKVG